jgi:23S rRNA (guanosine2251-2'-O)-methyltransferase
MTDFLFRRNTVLEALRGDRRQIYRLWIQEGAHGTGPIVASARSRGIPIETAGKQKLSQLAGDSSHQGVLLETGPYEYSHLENIMSLANERDEKPFLLLFDLLHGPQNIGTILRAAEACGIHGVVLQDRRAPDITPSVTIYSAGATEHLLIAQVTNLVQAIRELKAAGVWIVGLDMAEESQTIGESDLNIPLGIVLGHEGSGLRRLVRKNCDFLLKLPMRGQVASLNAATAGSIALYAAWQAREFEGAN